MLTPEEVQTTMAEFDRNRDGTVTFREYVQTLCGGSLQADAGRLAMQEKLQAEAAAAKSAANEGTPKKRRGGLLGALSGLQESPTALDDEPEADYDFEDDAFEDDDDDEGSLIEVRVKMCAVRVMNEM